MDWRLQGWKKELPFGEDIRGVHNSTQQTLATYNDLRIKNTDFKQETFVAFIEGREERRVGWKDVD